MKFIENYSRYQSQVKRGGTSYAIYLSKDKFDVSASKDQQLSKVKETSHQQLPPNQHQKSEQIYKIPIFL
jgi:hypothetical protein